MFTLLKVGQRMAIPTHTSILLTPTAQRTTGKAEPEIFLEIALRAVCQSYATSQKFKYGDEIGAVLRTGGRDVARGQLLESKGMLARM